MRHTATLRACGKGLSFAMKNATHLFVDLAQAVDFEEYLACQGALIDFVGCDAEPLKALVLDPEVHMVVRQDAMQLISWIDPERAVPFFAEIAESDLEGSLREAAKGLALRLETGARVLEENPEHFEAYVQRVRIGAAKAMFGSDRG